MGLKLERVAPIGRHKVIGSAQLYEKGIGRRHELLEMEIETYPDATRALGFRVRDERKRLNLTLRQGTQALGFESVVTMSELEHGEYVFDVHEAVRLLNLAAGKLRT